MIEGLENETSKEASHDGRQKQKIMIKYREKVKLKRRPRGYKLRKSWNKNKKNILSYLVLIVLLGSMLFVVFQITKSQFKF